MAKLSGDDNPAIIDRLFGPEYEGPLSDWDEWHALELGAYSGFVYGATGDWGIVALMVGVSLGVKAAEGEIQRQVAGEPHYFATGFLLGWFVGFAAYAGTHSVDAAHILHWGV